MTVIGTSMLAGCGVIPASINEANAIEAASQKLVAARHPQCDHGSAMVRYLATGDNGGVPGLDQDYADQVGTLNPAQIRAKTDDWITACDAKVDANDQLAAANAQQAVQEAQAAASAAQAEVEEAAQAAKSRELENKSLAVECASASGRFDAGEQRCYSTVAGNPSGGATTSCLRNDGTQTYLFPVAGSFATGHTTASRNSPGCFT